MEYRLFLAAFYLIGFSIWYLYFKKRYTGKVRLDDRKIKMILGLAFISFFVIAALINNFVKSKW